MYYAETWTRLKVDQKYVKVLTCGAGEGWRRSVGPIVWNMKKYFTETLQRNIVQTRKNRKANWIGHILREYCPLTHVIGGQIEERSDEKTRKKT